MIMMTYDYPLLPLLSIPGFITVTPAQDTSY
jgi:hypothetical protein